MSASNDALARDVLLEAWPAVLGEVPVDHERQLVQAIARFEGGYGLASFKLIDSTPGDTYGQVISQTGPTNNWGATQAGKPPCDPATSFVATDTSPRLVTADNPMGYYDACFKRNPTMQAGAESFLHILLVGSASHPRQSVRRAVATGSADEVASAMHASGYFEGFGATVEVRIDHYADAIEKNAQAIATSLGEPLLVMRGPAGTRVNLPGLVCLALGLGLLWQGVKG